MNQAPTKIGGLMPLLLSKETEEIKKSALSLCLTYQNYYLGAEHLFLALLEKEEIKKIFFNLSLNLNELKEKIISCVSAPPKSVLWEGIIETPRTKKIFKRALEKGEFYKLNQISPLIIFLTILLDENSLPVRVLKELNINLNKIKEETINSIKSPHFSNSINQIPPIKVKEKESFIANFSRNLTKLAKEGKLDPVIGRKNEIKRIIQVLSRKLKNNPILIGLPGVGKSAVVLGLAQKIAQGKVPEILKEKTILELNLVSVVAGTKHRGEFEERLQNIIKEVSANSKIILFIDEIHTLVGAGDVKGGMDASNILKPVLAQGVFPCIGATTISEYRRYIEADPALERRFQPILVKETSQEETLEILKGLKPCFEKHHGLKFQDEALISAIKLAARFLPERHLPDKAIDLIDEAASRLKTKTILPDSLIITPGDIAEVISLWTGIPFAKLTEEKSKQLLEMETMLKKRIINQEKALKSVCSAVKMAHAGLLSLTRPIGVFIFLGPTGVGKTELAKAMAEFLFENEKEIIRFDMSEYMEKHSVAKFLGAPPGYIGYEEEGSLAKFVRTKPYSVILLDEIEKAHPEIFDIFLQVFDEGALTDNKGRVINFCNSIIIMTSNLGTSLVDQEGNLILRNTALPEVQQEIIKILRKTFRAEFLNRIDEIIFFTPLGKEELKKILNLNLEKIKEKLKEEKKIVLEIEEEAFNFLLEKGYDLQYGARPLKRAVQDYLLKPLAEFILNKNPQNLILKVNLKEQELIFSAFDEKNEN
ncbi:MAG: ATP-dependent Clp protease ATP-binding subunit [Armatimonadetes bacterium]|nr:ATP-dependent Clp protease ATP-binding subunit [Armatimonadota bacterium]